MKQKWSLQTVLTSSAPVLSISTTVNLAAGDYTVEMIGRAAPDGIGAYFTVAAASRQGPGRGGAPAGDGPPARQPRPLRGIAQKL